VVKGATCGNLEMFLIPPNAKVNTFFEKKKQLGPMFLSFNGLSHEKYFCPMPLKKNNGG
jgi:hypothetical protein